jgi:predicted DNA-binding protein (MmcQ/YjbR family)
LSETPKGHYHSLFIEIRMNIESLREYCLSKPGAEETLPFGPDTLVYKVGGKVFLLTGLDSEQLRFNVKCNPDKAIELREEYPCVLPGWHMNKKHWNTIVVDGSVSSKQLKEWIDWSYDLVTKKPHQKNSKKK